MYPVMYYGPKTGVGLLLENFHRDQPRRIGGVGLGVGTLAAYGGPADVFRYYEINPDVKLIAEAVFTYLSESKAKVEVKLGDGRLSLEREDPQNFDVLVLDAFNGDAIPVHLLTMEAFDIYERHMKLNGVIAVHVTNNFVDLHSVMWRLARARGLKMFVINTEADRPNLIVDAHWVLLTRSTAALEIPEIAGAGAFAGSEFRDVTLWTDEHAPLFEILK
jgi:spermidine synthase